MKYSLVSLIFLKRSLVFPILLFSSISLHWSLRKAFLSLLAILWNSAFKWVYLSFSPLLFTSLLFTAICKASSDSHFAFLHFFFLGMVLITATCTVLDEPLSMVLQALCLSDLIPWIYLSLPLYFGHLMQRTDSSEKTLMLGKIEGRRRRGQYRMRWLDGITNSVVMSLSKLWEWWWTRKPGTLSPWGRKEPDMTEQLNWISGLLIYWLAFQ